MIFFLVLKLISWLVHIWISLWLLHLAAPYFLNRDTKGWNALFALDYSGLLFATERLTFEAKIDSCFEEIDGPYKQSMEATNA